MKKPGKAQAIKEYRWRKKAAQSTVDWAWHFATSASCPPDERIQVRGGVIYPGPYWLVLDSAGWRGPDACDFTDPEMTGLDCNFTNAYYYLGVILCYEADWLLFYYHWEPETQQHFEIVGGTTEWATPLEAEAEIDLMLNGTEAIYQERLPLCAVVLRNNGTTGIDGQILPIDPLNRGRSYLWKDVRPRNKLLM